MNKITLALVVVILSSCSHESHDNHGEQKTEQHSEKKKHHKPLELNNGAKWEANSETTIGVQNMVNHYESATDLNSVKSLHELASKYEEELNEIFSACTMKGEAHNQLHNFLLPLIDMVDQLKKCESMDTGNETNNRVGKHLVLYGQYFE